MKKLKTTKSEISIAVSKEVKLSKVETITCAYCAQQHTYERKRKAKKYCSNKCGVAYHGKFVRNKAKLAAYQTTYYTKNYAKRMIVSSRYYAKKKGIAHTLTEAHINNQLSSGMCQVTGLPITSNIGSGEARGVYSPSIDRTDNSVGYRNSNVRVVCWIFNLAKNKFSDRDLNNLAVALVASHLPPSVRKEFAKLLPANILSGLPSGYTL
jgi:endogenous inhibitor of DNA gyrase (YacG/DUF329 family)